MREQYAGRQLIYQFARFSGLTWIFILPEVGGLLLGGQRFEFGEELGGAFFE